MIHLTLRLFGLARTVRVWCVPAPGPGTDRQTPDASIVLDDAVWAVRHAGARGIVEGTCLSRALTLIKLLQGLSPAAELRIGIRRAEGALLAHAWVEHRGVPLTDDPEGLRAYLNIDPGGDLARVIWK